MKNDNDKSKFTFVNKQEIEFLDKEDNENDEELAIDKRQKAIEELKRLKKKEVIKVINTIIVMIIITALLFGFALFWQYDVSLMAIGDALWLVFALEFFAAWIMFIYNKNVLTSTIYGFKSFFLMFAGKRPKRDYYEYFKMVEQTPIPKYLYRVVFASSIVCLIPAVIILLIFIFD